MFARLGRRAYRRRWPLLALAAALLIAGLAFGTGVVGELKGGGFDNPGSESSRAERALVGEMGLGRGDIIPLFSSADLTVDDPAFAAEVQSALDPLRGDPAVASVMSFYDTGSNLMVSRDRHKTYAIITLRGSDDEKMETFRRLEPQLRSAASSPIQPARVSGPSLEIRLGGAAAADTAAQEIVEADLRRAEILSLPIVGALLVLFFGSPVAALLPVLMGGLSILSAFIALRLLAQATDISIFALNLMTVLGLGLGIDYSLLMVNRFREELQQRNEVQAAVSATMATAGRAVAFSGLAVALCLVALLFFPQMFLRTMAIGGILVVILALLWALTVLPALLGLLGPMLNALSLGRRRLAGEGGAIPLRGSPGPGGPGKQGSTFWHRISLGVMRYPIPVVAVVTAVLLLMGSPFLRIKTAIPDIGVFPPKAEVRQVYEALQLSGEFPGREISPLRIAVRGEGPILSPANVGALYDYVQAAGQVPGVARVDSIVSLDPRLSRAEYQALLSQPALWPPSLRAGIERLARGDLTMVAVVSQYEPFQPEAAEQVRALRALPEPEGFSALVGGLAAENLDTEKALKDTLPWALSFITLVMLVLLFLAFGSVVVPLKAVAMNALSLSASFGALVWVFQEGNLQWLIRFQSPGSIDLTMPILMFAIAFGLSMDYEVFLLSRIKEEYDRSGDNALSVARGLERTGRIITSAALVLVVVNGAFATGSMIFIKELGVGMALAVFLDATVVRALLVPATMRLLGDLNWWAPTPLRRAWQRLPLGGPGE